MKKIMAIFLISLGVLGLTGCGITVRYNADGTIMVD